QRRRRTARRRHDLLHEPDERGGRQGPPLNQLKSVRSRFAAADRRGTKSAIVFLDRRSGFPRSMHYLFDDFELDDELFELRRCGERVPLRPQALDTLLLLVRAADRVVTKDEILREVWSGVVVSETAVPQAITAIRRALGEGGDDQRIVQTVRTRG